MNPDVPIRKPVDPAHPPAPVDIAEESIAGEEDPGASLDDLGIAPPPPPEPAIPPRPPSSGG